LCFYVIVAGKNEFHFFLIIWGKFVVEEVVTQGESVAVPIKGVEGSRSALPDLGVGRYVGVGFGRQRILCVIVVVFSEMISHNPSIVSCSYFVMIDGLGMGFCGGTCG